MSEGDTLDVTFGLNVKGSTHFQALVHSILAQGYVTAERVRAGKYIIVVLQQGREVIHIARIIGISYSSNRMQ